MANQGWENVESPWFKLGWMGQGNNNSKWKKQNYIAKLGQGRSNNKWK
jgi:hypothetical protein